MALLPEGLRFGFAEVWPKNPEGLQAGAPIALVQLYLVASYWKCSVASADFAVAQLAPVSKASVAEPAFEQIRVKVSPCCWKYYWTRPSLAGLWTVGELKPEKQVQGVAGIVRDL